MSVIDKIRQLNNKLISSSLIRGIFWNFFGNIVARTANLVASIYVAYFLTKEEYGQLGFLRSTISTFVIFGTFGFGIAATKFFAGDEFKDKRGDYGIVIRTFSFLVAFIISLFLVIFVEPIAVKMGGGPELILPLKITAISVLFLSLNGVQNGILVGLQKFKDAAKSLSISSILSAIITIVLTKYYKLEGYAVGFAIGSLFNWAICYYFIRTYSIDFKIHFSNLKKTINDVLKISIPAILSGLVVMPITWYSNSVIINTSNGLESLGTYNAISNITAITLAVISIISQAVLPFAIKNFNKNNLKFELFNYYAPWLIGVGFSIPLILFPEIVALVYHNKYAGLEVERTAILVGLCTIIISQRQGIAKNFVASGKMWISFWGNAVWGILLIISLYFLKDLKAFGYALSFLIAYLINSLVFIPLYIKLKLIDRSLVYSKIGFILSILSIIGGFAGYYLPIVPRILIFVIVMVCLVKIVQKLIKEK